MKIKEIKYDYDELMDIQFVLNEMLKLYQEDNYLLGLCHTLDILVISRGVDYKPVDLTNYYIHTNVSTIRQKFGSLYYWKKGRRKPRMRWLRKHIRKINKQLEI